MELRAKTAGLVPDGGEEVTMYSIFFTRKTEFNFVGTGEDLRLLFPEAPEGVDWEVWIRRDDVETRRFVGSRDTHVAEETCLPVDYVDVEQEMVY